MMKFKFIRTRADEIKKLKGACPECKSDMVLRNSKHGKFYGCSKYPKCRASHGAHEDGTPLGKPADQETKDARIEAHNIFDMLWKGIGPLTRKEAYKWMQEKMGLSEAEAHIGMFDKEQCEKLIQVVIENIDDVYKENRD
jgi:ssDNA-binding Zn-finger/Zn-ribbon topoisomerase 1